jgi:invasion protein IalB
VKSRDFFETPTANTSDQRSQHGMMRVSATLVAFTLALSNLPGWSIALAQMATPSDISAASGKKTTAPATSAGQAQNPATNIVPDMTSETYGDWTLRCQHVTGGRRCEVSQTLVIQGQEKPIAIVALSREKKAEPPRLVVQVPTNITFEGGVRALTADGNTAADLVFRRCSPAGCFADAALDDATIAKLKTQTEPGSIKFRDATDQEISLPLSLKGFGSAIEAFSRL